MSNQRTSATPEVIGAGSASRSLAGFDFQALNGQFVANGLRPPLNHAAPYGVTILPADVATAQTYWKVIGIYHLLPHENKRRHNVYLEALDEAGTRMQNPALRVGWIWAGKSDGPADPKRLDKPADEPAADVPLEKEMTVTLWLEGDGPSDQVAGLHTRHPDEPGGEGSGNTFGHHSYYVVFQRTRKQSIPVTPIDPSGGDGLSSDEGEPPSESGDDSLPARVLRRIGDKVGIDANAPLTAAGAIAPQVADPGIIADSGVGWVRLNFIRGPYQGPTDPTWQQLYRTIVEGLRSRGLRIYALVGHEIVGDPGEQFRNGVDAPLSNAWIGEYVDAFEVVALSFHDAVDYFETFNEPDDWHSSNTNWIHPSWLAVMLQQIHDRVRANPTIRHIKLVSGPLQGFDNNDNAGARYLERVYGFGKRFFQWGTADHPVPFHGIGYHLYIAEGERQNVGAALRQKYQRYMDELRQVIRSHDRAKKPIFISEIGWANDGGLHEQQQAALEAALDVMVNDGQVDIGFWFCTQDFPGKPYGIYTAAGLSADQRKPAFQTLQQLCTQPLVVAADEDPAVDTTDLVPTLVDKATYVQNSDLVKDGTVVLAGEPFIQRWTMENSGTTTWATGYQFVWTAGASLGAPPSVPVTRCAPGERLQLTVPFRAPPQPGNYTSTWRLVNRQGEPFGQRVWTTIQVAAPAFTPAPREMSRTMELETEEGSAEGTPRSPIPPSSDPNKPLIVSDPELYAAWRDHMRRGFENNQTMFEQVLTGFMNPYWTTVWMYRILFGVGVAAFVTAAIVSLADKGAVTTGIFGGLSVAAFLGYFLSRPLQALEENLQFITWLGIIYNSYWTRLAYTSDLKTVQAELEDATDDAIAKIKELMDKHAERSKNRSLLGG